MSSSSPAKSTRRPQAEGNCASVSTPANAGKDDASAAATAAEKKSAVNPMVGRKILKPLAGDKLCDGFVVEHKPAGSGREETWVLRWELDSEQDEEVTKAVLDKRINLKAVQEREFPPTDSEKAGTRKDRAAKTGASSDKPAAPAKAPAATKASPKAAAGAKASSATKAAAKPTKASKATPKRRASAGRGRPLGSKSKKAKKATAPEAGTDELLASKKDVGKLVAKQFEEGIFTGRVVKVRKGVSPLWQVRYEDEDTEDLDKEEAVGCFKLYQTLRTKFSEATGTPVPQEEEDEPA